MTYRPDNVRPKLTFKGDMVVIKFKYPPTQAEFDAAIAHVVEAMDYANTMTGQNLQIIGWPKQKES